MRKVVCALALAAANGLPALRSRVEKEASIETQDDLLQNLCYDTKDWKASEYKCKKGSNTGKVGPKCRLNPPH